MIQVLAPKMPRGWSWVWLPIAMAALMTSSALAQVGGGAPKAAPAKAADKPAGDEPPSAITKDFKLRRPPQEIYPDPLSKQAIGVFNPLPYPSPPLKTMGTPNDRATVQTMASGGFAPNAELIRRYIEHYAAELSKRENLNAFISPPPNLTQSTARAIEKAVSDLLNPITIARANVNANSTKFLETYTRQLFDSSFVKLLDNNLISRIDAMIVLGMVGSGNSKDLDVYIAQINKPDQVMWVKQWASHGITNATDDGKKTLDATRTIQAVEALTKFLDGDAKAMPWPVQMRALEAIGSLRMAVNNTSRGRIDAASAVMPYLLDPEARPEVRAWAAHALGFMNVPTGVKPYNFPLLADAIGRAAADLGDRVVAEYDQDPAGFADPNRRDEAAGLTSLLLFQVYGGLAGEPGARESGLLQMNHPNASAISSYLKELSNNVQAEAKQAVELLRSGGGDALKAQRDKLAASISELRAFLASKPPKDRRLVPEGPEFAPRVAAGAPGP